MGKVRPWNRDDINVKIGRNDGFRDTIAVKLSEKKKHHIWMKTWIMHDLFLVHRYVKIEAKQGILPLYQIQKHLYDI